MQALTLITMGLFLAKGDGLLVEKGQVLVKVVHIFTIESKLHFVS